MRARHRWWLWTTGLAALLLLGIAVASWWVARQLGPVMARERVEAALTSALARPVSVGDVVLSPWRGRAGLRDVRVAAGPTWESGTMVAVGRVDATVSIASLWRREVVLSRILLEDVDVRYALAGGGEPFVLPERIPDRVQLGPLAVIVRAVEIARGHVLVTDPATKRTAEIDGLEARALPAEGGLDVTASAARLRVALAADGAEILDQLRAVARLRGSTLTIEPFATRWEGEGFEVTGTIRDIGASTSLALRATGKLALPALARRLGWSQAEPSRPGADPPRPGAEPRASKPGHPQTDPSSRFDIQAPRASKPGHPQADPSSRFDTIGLAAGLAALDAAVEGPVAAPTVSGRFSIPALTAGALTAQKVAGQIAWADGRLRVSDVVATALGGEIRGALEMAPARPGDARVAIRVRDVALDALESLLAVSYGLRGHLTGDAEVTGDLRRLLDGQGRAHLESADLALPGDAAKLGPASVTVDARLAGGAVEVTQGQARWPSLRVESVKGTLTADGPRGLVAVIAADAGRLARAWGEDRIGGQLGLTATANGRWKDPKVDGRARSAGLEVAGVKVVRVDVPFDLEGSTLRVRGATAAVGESRLEATATLSAPSRDLAKLREDLRFDASVAAPAARLEDLDALVPPAWRGRGRFSLSGRLTGTLASWKGEGRVVGTGLEVGGQSLERLAARFTVDRDGLTVSEMDGPLSSRIQPMDFALTEQQEVIRKEVATLARSFSPDYWLEKDRKAEYPWEWIKAFADGGWLGMIVPEEYGGSGLGVTDAAILLHEICAAGAGTSGASPIHFYMFPPMPLIRYGAESLKRSALPRIATGEIVMSFGVTEPNAGTDTSRIQTFARAEGDGFVVDGRKVWNTNAQHATHILLLARTAARDPRRPFKGMTLFFTPFDRTKITVRTIEKLGRAAVDSNEIFIDGLEVPAGDVVGTVGDGFYHLLDSLNPERIFTGIEAVGIGRAALERATQYAKERVVFDRPIGQNQAIAHPLAQAWARLECAELMCLKAAWLYDAGRPCGAESNAAKLLAAEAGFEACDVALQTHGGYGYAKEFHVERLWREVRLYKIAPVSQQMALNYLAEHVLGLPKSY